MRSPISLELREPMQIGNPSQALADEARFRAVYEPKE